MTNAQIEKPLKKAAVLIDSEQSLISAKDYCYYWAKYMRWLRLGGHASDAVEASAEN